MKHTALCAQRGSTRPWQLHWQNWQNWANEEWWKLLWEGIISRTWNSAHYDPPVSNVRNTTKKTSFLCCHKFFFLFSRDAGNSCQVQSSHFKTYLKFYENYHTFKGLGLKDTLPVRCTSMMSQLFYLNWNLLWIHGGSRGSWTEPRFLQDFFFLSDVLKVPWYISHHPWLQYHVVSIRLTAWV